MAVTCSACATGTLHLTIDSRMEMAIERLVALACFVLGLSHIVQPRPWAELFIDWRSKGTTGVFYNGLLHFVFGALIVAFHNVWRGIPLLVTLLGWGLDVEGSALSYLPEARHENAGAGVRGSGV